MYGKWFGLLFTIVIEFSYKISLSQNKIDLKKILSKRLNKGYVLFRSGENCKGDTDWSLENTDPPWDTVDAIKASISVPTSLSSPIDYLSSLHLVALLDAWSPALLSVTGPLPGVSALATPHLTMTWFLHYLTLSSFSALPSCSVVLLPHSCPLE